MSIDKRAAGRENVGRTVGLFDGVDVDMFGDRRQRPVAFVPQRGGGLLQCGGAGDLLVEVGDDLQPVLYGIDQACDFAVGLGPQRLCRCRQLIEELHELLGDIADFETVGGEFRRQGDGLQGVFQLIDRAGDGLVIFGCPESILNLLQETVDDGLLADQAQLTADLRNHEFVDDTVYCTGLNAGALVEDAARFQIHRLSGVSFRVRIGDIVGGRPQGGLCGGKAA